MDQFEKEKITNNKQKIHRVRRKKLALRMKL